MTKDLHWTEESLDDFRFKVAFDFVAQLQEVMRASGMKQSDLAATLDVTPGRVSQVFNNPANLNLRSMVEWTRKLGQKMALVLYDDGDAENRDGPIDSDVFRTCWDKLGRPHDHGEIPEYVLMRRALSNFDVVDGGEDCRVIPIRPWNKQRRATTEDQPTAPCYTLVGVG